MAPINVLGEWPWYMPMMNEWTSMELELVSLRTKTHTHTHIYKYYLASISIQWCFFISMIYTTLNALFIVYINGDYCRYRVYTRHPRIDLSFSARSDCSMIIYFPILLQKRSKFMRPKNYIVYIRIISIISMNDRIFMSSPFLISYSHGQERLL